MKNELNDLFAFNRSEKSWRVGAISDGMIRTAVRVLDVGDGCHCAEVAQCEEGERMKWNVGVGRHVGSLYEVLLICRAHGVPVLGPFNAWEEMA